MLVLITMETGITGQKSVQLFQKSPVYLLHLSEVSPQSSTQHHSDGCLGAPQEVGKVQGELKRQPLPTVQSHYSRVRAWADGIPCSSVPY